MEFLIPFFFVFLLFVVFLYSLSQLDLLLGYLKYTKNRVFSEKFDFSDSSQLPSVTIQLPIYNEKEVVERLLKNIAQINYPWEKLQIQVLDDSNDDSKILTEKIIARLRKTGLPIEHLCRPNREGYKAGALKDGLKYANGEFIAIFDSDFLPHNNWLKETLPYFKDPKIGMVQTRWGHLNRDYSLLTKIQAFALDFHFILEQNGRNYGNCFINFNGTAGVWRKKCILDAGNWEGDTLTEDLDLSYRAQLKHWKFKYLENIETPAELPITIAAARSQQFRWNKGGAENFQKNYRKLLRDKSVLWKAKFHGFFHLLNSSLFIVVLILAVISLPVLFVLDKNPYPVIVGAMWFFSLSTLIFFCCHGVVFLKIHGNKPSDFFAYIGMYFVFFSVVMGFSMHNSLAVIKGHLRHKSEFIRTPKFNVLGKEKGNNSKNPIYQRFSFSLFLEFLLVVYFTIAVYCAFLLNNFSLLIFHLMLVFGFGFVVLKSVFKE